MKKHPQLKFLATGQLCVAIAHYFGSKNVLHNCCVSLQEFASVDLQETHTLAFMHSLNY